MLVEPSRLSDDAIDDVFKWCFEIQASDITYQTGQPVWADVYGRIQPVTKRRLSPAEVVDVLNRIYGPNGAAQIASGRDIDIAYEVKVSRNQRYRFRINATGILVDGTDGIQITARTLPEDPPKLSSMNVEPEIVENYSPRQGMVLVTGPTGSGKSTLLAGMIRGLAEDPDANHKILTYEAPIEFVYDNVAGPSTIISQTEIPRHLPSFAAGVRNALRRKPTIILVGEARDAETIAACGEASLTGHLVFSTVHANGVAETIRRMSAVFPAEERQGRAIDLMESLRMVITQALLRTIDGNRVAIREYLVFDEYVRDKMLQFDVDDWPDASRQLLKERGQTMEMAARKVFEQGVIDERTLKLVTARAEAGGH
ncbi:MAG: Dot/Icm type IV secretion system ATPase DotB [Alphaproteobacteria bacterium]|nr:Dot/Icm type IV secretion system ATPase DotB [Alphaproteobacteria bacterium SS10]